jgi:hypothetical protein
LGDGLPPIIDLLLYTAVVKHVDGVFNYMGIDQFKGLTNLIETGFITRSANIVDEDMDGIWGDHVLPSAEITRFQGLDN